jgi:uncharacterized protein
MTDTVMTQADYDRLAGFLGAFPSPDAMNLEELDGYLSALACSPEEVLPEEYFPQLWGAAGDDDELFPDLEVLREFVDLVNRHFAAVMDRLDADEDFVPLLLENDVGAITGNDWAQGFVRAMDLCADDWGDLFEDEQMAGFLVPIVALAYEHDPDPEVRPFDEPVDEEQRELLLAGLGVAVPLIYEYFAPLRDGTAYREDDEDPEPAPYRREAPKVGRNEPCPCGSGKKYKRCCGANA